MATSSISPTSSTRKPTATPFRSFKPNSKADWLGPALLAAKTITAGAECVPFPYVKGAFGVIVILLETAQKVKKNRDDLKELCENSMEIMKIVRDQISSHGPMAAEKLKTVCEELEGTLQKIVDEIRKWQDAPRGFYSHLKEMVKSSSITDKIGEYQKKIQTLCSNLKMVAAIDTNFQVHKIHATLATIAPNLSVIQTARSINNCPPPSRIFHGRQAILAKMHQCFTEDLGKQHIYVLYGLGGSGKTQIALKFIDESASKFSDIFLIDTSTPDTIDSGLKSIAVTKKIGDTAQDALDWFCSKQNDWLLFFDNADDPKINLHNFFPHCKHGNILITSRNPQLRGYGSHSHVSDMEEVDAVELLLRSAAQDITPQNKDAATEIVKALWYLPLAIVQAGAFILKSGSLNSYLTLCKKNKEQLLREKPAQSHDHYAWTVYTTWQISFDQLSPPAAMLLQLCSFLHHGGISEAIFSNASRYRFPLSAYSLINLDVARNIFSIHPLVHTWSRNTLTTEEIYQSCMIAIMGMSIDEISDEDVQLASLALLPHIDGLLHNEAETDFGVKYGKLFLHAANYKKAEEVLVQAIEKHKNILGENHAATLDAMNYLAVAYLELGQYQKAQKVLIVVVEKTIQCLGEDHRQTMEAMNTLAVAYTNLGQFKEAERLQTVVVEKRRHILGEAHPKTLKAMHILAMVFDKLGHFNEAAEIERVVLEKEQRIWGDDHPGTLITMNNLALSYRGLGQFKKARDLQVVLLESQRKILGDGHPDTLTSLGNLALTYRDLSRFKEAEELQGIVLENQRKIYGDNHPSTLLAMSNLAFTYHHLGRDKEAEKLQTAVLKKRQEVLGNDHPDTLRAMNHIAMTYHNMSRLNESEELQIVTLEKRRRILGEDHPDTMSSMNNLARVYQALGKCKEAMELQLVVVEKRRKLSGVDHPETLRVINTLALIYQSLGQFQNAEDLQKMVVEKRSNIIGDDHPDTLGTMNDLAMTYHSLTRFKEAQELQILVLEKQKNILGEDNPATLLSMNNLAMTYQSLGQFQEAEELQFVALEKRKSLLGEDHPDTMVSITNLALIYRSLGRFQEAEELQEQRKNI
ncbi:hypothetical protein FB451DRAFT_1446342 [Mycena latifolia]|nr:hypothetical protein FB451DRAFT_1446342 [Mycena latifolia]